MALSNRLGTASFTLEGDTIKLQSSFGNQAALHADTGMEFFDFLNHLDSPRQLTKLFYHFQINRDEHSEEAIYNCFFGNLSAYNGELQERLVKTMAELTGVDENAALAQVQSNEEKKAEG